jgi:succinyl-diaminopimelate desuccinylase
MSGAIARSADLSPPLEQALSFIALNLEEAIGDLGRMVGIDTSFPPGEGYGRFADLLEALASPLGFDCRRVLVPKELWYLPEGQARGERVNVIATGFCAGAVAVSSPDGRSEREPELTSHRRGASPGRLRALPVCGLYFHTDTVPPAPDWRRPPLALSREGNRLYGLGTADMKGTIAAALMALRAARSYGIELAYDPVLLFCTDEEGGLYPGIRHLAEQGLLEGHILNFNGGAVPRIWAGCFGSINLLVRMHGRAAHAGDSQEGINAIEAALPVLVALKALQPKIAARSSALPPPPHLAGRKLSPRLTIAAAHGGSSGGSVPPLFEILVNRRYAPEESFDEALAEIEAAIRAAMQDSPAELEVKLVGHLSPVSDPTGPHWPRWQAALSRGFGWAPSDFRVYGATSSSDFGWVQKTGMREILLGGLGRPDRNVHAAEEHTTLEDLVALAQSILAYLAADFRADILPEAQRSLS